jgi:hypothetical protein
VEADTPDIEPAVREEVMTDLRSAQAKVRAEVLEFQARLMAVNLTAQQIHAALDYEKTSGAKAIRNAGGAIRHQAEQASSEKRFWLLYAAHQEFCGAHDCKGATIGEAPPPSPQWIQQPTKNQLNSAWPKLAILLFVGGYADLDCASTDFGILVNCEVIREGPDGFGFAAAALAVSSYYRRPPAMRGERTQLRVAFPFPDAAGLQPPKAVRKQGPQYTLAREVVDAETSPAILERQSAQMVEAIDQVELPGVSDAFRRDALAVLRGRLHALTDDALAEEAEHYADLLTEPELRARLAYLKGPNYAALVAMDEKMAKTYQQLSEIIYGRVAEEAGRLYCAKHDCPKLPPYRGPRTAADPLPPFKP